MSTLAWPRFPLLSALLLTACSELGPPRGSEPPPLDAGQAVDAALADSALATLPPGPLLLPDAESPLAPEPPAVPYVLKEVAANGLVFDVWLAGPSDGEAVLLLHGFPQTSYEWRHVVAQLVAHGYRVIVPDQRGYSPKARPPRTEDYAVILLAQDAIALADALSARAFHLVGHDWGGGVAWLVAKLVPQRVMSLTAVGTPHPDAMNGQLADPNSCQHRASAYFDDAVRPDAAARFIADPTSFSADVSSDPLPEAEQYDKVLRNEPALDAAFAWYRANIDERKFNAIALGKVDVPTLLAFGARERFFCRETAELSASFMAAPFRFALIEEVGHWIPDQASAPFAALLLPHLAAQRGRVRGSPVGPDQKRALGAGLSGHACLGAPSFEIPAGLISCGDTCAAGHCLPAALLGTGSEILPACPASAGQGAKCVPDGVSRTLGRVSFAACKSWLGADPAVCVPRCFAGPIGFLLGRDGCGEDELCAPCSNPLDGKATGACSERCQGL